jgi:assimilatory nitrate reductase catalytic subunit
VRVHNGSGTVTALVLIDDAQPTGQVFSPIHWSNQYSGNACVNNLIPPVVDPISGQPQLKFARVSLSPVAVRTWGCLLTRELPALPALAYWSRVAVPGGYLTLFAVGASGNADDVRHSLLEGLRTRAQRCIHYQDASGGDFRDVGIAANQLLFACYLNARRNGLPDRDWLSAQLTPARVDELAPLLAGIDPGTPSRGRLVCTCWEVGEQEIGQAIAAGAGSVEHLGAQLRCGTQCGSCIPELRRLLVAAVSEQAA